MTIKTLLKKGYERLIKIRGEPREISLGFALGIFIGMSPTMGFQMPIAIFFASILGWNKLSSAIGVWITNPITAPFIYGITYILGAKILGLRKAHIAIHHLTNSSIFTIISKAPEIIWALTIGGVIIGIPLAVISYYVCYSAVETYRKDIKYKIEEQKEKMAKRRKERLKRKMLKKLRKKGKTKKLV